MFPRVYATKLVIWKSWVVLKTNKISSIKQPRSPISRSKHIILFFKVLFNFSFIRDCWPLTSNQIMLRAAPHSCHLTILNCFFFCHVKGFIFCHFKSKLARLNRMEIMKRKVIMPYLLKRFTRYTMTDTIEIFAIVENKHNDKKVFLHMHNDFIFLLISFRQIRQLFPII